MNRIAARPWLLALVAPIALALAGYSRSLRGEFQLDDYTGILENGAIKAFWPWLRSLRPEALVAGRPLTSLTFAANYAAGRLDPLGYHLVNVALHLAVVLLAGLLALRVAALAGAERPRWIALGVAGLFAVHPLQSQAVSYVSQRAELLASALYVATLLLLLARDPAARPRPWRHWAAALATFALGIAAKPIVITLPAAWLAIQLAAAPGATPGATPEEGSRWRRALPAIAPFAVAAGLFAVALLVALRGRLDAGFSVAGTSQWLYFLTQLRALLVYLRMLAWPAGQSVDWTFPTSPGLADPATLGAAMAIGLVAAAAVLLLVRGRRRATPGGAVARLAGLGLAWFFIVLSVTSSFVPLADNLVEHRVYLASWGLFLAAVAAVDGLAARFGRRRLAVGAWLVALVVLTVALYRRNAVWESKEALWSDVLAKSPGSVRARINLGHAYSELGRTEEAMRQWELALPYAGGNVAQEAQLLLNLGGAQLVAGRLEDARRSLAAGLQLLPDHDGLLSQMAILAGASRDGATAESLARRALGINPSQPIAWVVLGNLGLERKDWAGALSAYDRAIAVDPDRGDAHYARSIALGRLGRHDEECAALREALRARLRPQLRSTVESKEGARCR